MAAKSPNDRTMQAQHSALPAFAYLALLHARDADIFNGTNLVGTALSKLMRLGNQSFGNMPAVAKRFGRGQAPEQVRRRGQGASPQRRCFTW